MIAQGTEQTVGDLLSSPTFWFASVLVAGVVNIVAGALWRHLMRSYNDRSTRAKTKAFRRILRIAAEISDTPGGAALFAHRANEDFHTHNALLTLACFAMIIALWVRGFVTSGDAFWEWASAASAIVAVVASLLGVKFKLRGSDVSNALELSAMAKKEIAKDGGGPTTEPQGDNPVLSGSVTP